MPASSEGLIVDLDEIERLQTIPMVRESVDLRDDEPSVRPQTTTGAALEELLEDLKKARKYPAGTESPLTARRLS